MSSVEIEKRIVKVCTFAVILFPDWEIVQQSVKNLFSGNCLTPERDLKFLCKIISAPGFVAASRMKQGIDFMGIIKAVGKWAASMVGLEAIIECVEAIKDVFIGTGLDEVGKILILTRTAEDEGKLTIGKMKNWNRENFPKNFPNAELFKSYARGCIEATVSVTLIYGKALGNLKHAKTIQDFDKILGEVSSKAKELEKKKQEDFGRLLQETKTH